MTNSLHSNYSLGCNKGISCVMAHLSSTKHPPAVQWDMVRGAMPGCGILKSLGRHKEKNNLLSNVSQRAHSSGTLPMARSCDSSHGMSTYCFQGRAVKGNGWCLSGSQDSIQDIALEALLLVTFTQNWIHLILWIQNLMGFPVAEE